MLPAVNAPVLHKVTTHKVTTHKVIVVMHGATPFGRELARGLADGGAHVALVGSTGDEDSVAHATGGVGHTVHADTRAEYERALADVAAALGPINAVVAPVLPGPTAGPAMALTSMSEQQWFDACEGPLRVARNVVQAAFGALQPPREHGGRIVLIASSSAISGQAGQVGFATAAEGARSMTRVLAKSWGRVGIRLHWVGVPTALLTGHDEAARPLAAWDAALGEAPDVRRDVAAVITALVSAETAALTATTTIVDGGFLPPL